MIGLVVGVVGIWFGVGVFGGCVVDVGWFCVFGVFVGDLLFVCMLCNVGCGRLSQGYDCMG